MAVVSDITTVANATNPATHAFTLVQYTNSQGRKIARFEKDKKGESGTTGALSTVWGVGEDASVATTARTNALAALNAVRRHRYAGAPGSPSGATVTTWPDGAATAPTVDSN
jgi:hypothetical protein